MPCQPEVEVWAIPQSYYFDALVSFSTQPPTCNQLGSGAVLLEEGADNEVVFGVVVRINKQVLVRGALAYSVIA